MTKFTEGPWHLEVNENNVTYVASSAPNQGDICDLYNKISDHECVLKENAEANGHLISAAPELYEALFETIEIMKSGINHPLKNSGKDVVKNIIAKHENVLSKARGKS